jgi:putative hydrolase of the HAD superfamily
MPIDAVLLDFYGTLARATRWVSADEILAEHGYSLDAEHRALYFAGGPDGTEHDEHSRSREHYLAWQHARTIAMLEASDVHPDEHDLIVEKLRHGTTQRVIEAYAEVPAVLTELRARGLRIVICSNWDWDLREAVDEAGLTDAVDAVVSSAWVGARKPHPRIFAAALAEAGAGPDRSLFVGDTWGPDVLGPRTAAIRPLYLRRPDHWGDDTAPDVLDPAVPVAADLTGVLHLLDPDA